MESRIWICVSFIFPLDLSLVLSEFQNLVPHVAGNTDKVVSLLEQIVRLCWKLCTLLAVTSVIFFAVWCFSYSRGVQLGSRLRRARALASTGKGAGKVCAVNLAPKSSWQRFFAKNKQTSKKNPTNKTFRLFLFVGGVGWVIWLTARSPQVVSPDCFAHGCS